MMYKMFQVWSRGNQPGDKEGREVLKFLVLPLNPERIAEDAV
jgi:hypothetical protein